MYSLKSLVKHSATIFFTLTMLSSCSSSNPLSTKDLMFNVNSYHSSFLFVPNGSFNIAYTAPDYVNNKSFSEIEVTFGDKDYQLPGTITIPARARQKYPVVILVHGSGPNDRDESAGANKPFKDIAWGLASQGIAVFRYDKRTRIYSEKLGLMSNGFTPKEEVTDDVKSAINFIKNRPELNLNGKVYIVGHDLGGMLAPKIAQENSAVSGIAIMGGNSQPLEDVMSHQIDNLTKFNDTEKLNFKQQIDNVKSLKLNPNQANLTLPYDIPVKYWNYLNNYTQTEVAKNLNIPILVMQGESDNQVSMNDYTGWQNALSNNTDATFKTYKGLNHLFFEGEMIDENNQPNHVSEEVIDDINSWIKSS